jgi:hypothetical protein
MSTRWEYARLYASRDPQDKESTRTWLQLPKDTKWVEKETEEFWSLLDELGADGWELLGPPTSEKGVFTYKAATDVWHDRSLWIELTYWFKRERD